MIGLIKLKDSRNSFQQELLTSSFYISLYQHISKLSKNILCEEVTCISYNYSVQ